MHIGTLSRTRTWFNTYYKNSTGVLSLDYVNQKKKNTDENVKPSGCHTARQHRITQAHTLCNSVLIARLDICRTCLRESCIGFFVLQEIWWPAETCSDRSYPPRTATAEDVRVSKRKKRATTMKLQVLERGVVPSLSSVGSMRRSGLGGSRDWAP